MAMPKSPCFDCGGSREGAQSPLSMRCPRCEYKDSVQVTADHDYQEYLAELEIEKAAAAINDLGPLKKGSS